MSWLSDPGSIGRGIGRVVGGFVKGGPIGAARAAYGASQPQRPGRPAVPTPPPSGRGAGGVYNTIDRFANGWLPGGIAPGTGWTATANQGVCCPQGYHPAKDGSGRCVRNRSMNPANGKALRRAVRRIRAGEKIFRQIFRMTHKKTGVTLKGKGK